MMRKNKRGSFGRTISNWKKYRGYIKEYTGVRDDLVHKLLRNTVDFGFNEGVEIFELKVNNENTYNKHKKESELNRLSDMKSVSIEDMIKEKNRMEKIEEEQKTYKYDPSWKPTFEEITNSKYDVVYEKVHSSSMYFKIYHAHDKLVYVGVSVVPGTKTNIMVREKFADVKKIAGGLFDFFTPPAESKEKTSTPKIDIDHVKKAMGTNEKTDSDLNDLLDDIFKGD